MGKRERVEGMTLDLRIGKSKMSPEKTRTFLRHLLRGTLYKSSDSFPIAFKAPGIFSDGATQTKR